MESIAPPSTRELRGIALYRDYANEITFEDGIWFVPSTSSSGDKVEETISLIEASQYGVKATASSTNREFTYSPS